MKLKLTLIGFTTIMLVTTSASSVSAEDLIITDNAQGSSNSVSVSSNEQNTVSQTSTATIENNTTTNSNTGGNTASDNQGATTTTTGDTHTAVTSETSANTSTATIGSCCSDNGGTAVVSGNGQNSSNNISITNTSQNTSAVTNVATVVNNVVGNANTGGNTANDNRGPVHITTGSVYVNEVIKNGPINVSSVSILGGNGQGVLVKIAGNARDSVNTVSVLNNKTNIVAITNITNIINNSVWNLNTGDNKAKDNDGDVTIATGDIHTNVSIDNGPINSSTVKIDDCCKDNQNPPVNPPSNPPTTPSNPGGGNNGGGSSGGGSSSGSSSGSVLGAVGNILPATGNYWFFLLLMGNALLLALGTYLRLRSGRSPAFALAI